MRHRAFRPMAALFALFLALAAGFAADPNPNAPINPADYKSAIRVACVGDSITAGYGTKNRSVDAYPAQLDRMLTDKWDVRNFGVSGATLLNRGDKPYQKEEQFRDALAFRPDVVLIMLGTNDTKPQNWKFKDDFAADYKDLIVQFAKLPSKPRIFVCHPVPVPRRGNFGITAAGVKAEIPIIDAVAKTEKVGVIDMHGALKGKPELIPDSVHPNTDGATQMAKTAYKALTGKEFTGAVPPKGEKAKE